MNFNVKITDILFAAAFYRTHCTWQTQGVQLGDLVLGQDQPDEPGHVGEGPRLDVLDDVVRDIDREQLGLRAQNQRGEFVWNETKC